MEISTVSWPLMGVGPVVLAASKRIAAMYDRGYDGSFTTPDCHEEIKWLLAFPSIALQMSVLSFFSIDGMSFLIHIGYIEYIDVFD